MAVAIKLIAQKRINREDTVVVSITGNGYKTLEAVAQSLAEPYLIEARLKEFDALFERLNGRRSLAGAA